MRTQSCVAFAASHFTQRYGVTFPLLTSARCYGGSQHTPIILFIHHMRPCTYCCCISAFDKLLNEHRRTKAHFAGTSTADAAYVLFSPSVSFLVAIRL